MNDKSIGLGDYLNQASRVIKSYMGEPTWVVADIVDIKNSRGHIYLELAELDDLKQSQASARGTVWSSKARELLPKFKKGAGFDLVKNTKVMILCELTINPKFGMSINILDINPSYTLGESKSKILEILAETDKAGITNKNKQFPRPNDFSNVIVLSPAGAAGLGDFKSDADKIQSLGICNFDYHTATFQGADTEKSILGELREIYKKVRESNNKYDALIIIRGGGATGDLNHLNSLNIAKAICLFNIPVFVGIGHERDETALDYVANIKFDTPSKVIGFIKSTIINNYNNFNKIMKEIKKEVSNKTIEQKLIINNLQNGNKLSVLRLIESHKSSSRNTKLYIIDEVRRQARIKIDTAKNTTQQIKMSSREKVSRMISDASNKRMSIFFAAKNNKRQEINNVVNNIMMKLKNDVLFNLDKIKNTKQNINLAVNNKVANYKASIENCKKLIDASSPDRIKELGYSIVRVDGKIVKKLSELDSVEKISIDLLDGSKEAKIIN